MTDISFDVKNDIGKVLSKFPWVQGGMIPLLVSNVLNSTARHVKEKVKEEVTKDFDRPTRFTLNAPYAWFSKPGTLAAEVRIRDFAPKGTPAIKFLAPEIYGGGRNHKGHERRLIEAGLMPSDMYAVPAKSGLVPLDAHGNIRPTYFTKMLSGLKAFNGVGFDANRSPESQKRKAGKLLDFFVVLPGDRLNRGRGLPPGVYQKFGDNLSRMVLAYVRAPSYPKRYSFFETAQEAARVYFPDKLYREAQYLTNKTGQKINRDLLRGISNIIQ